MILRRTFLFAILFGFVVSCSSDKKCTTTNDKEQSANTIDSTNTDDTTDAKTPEPVKPAEPTEVPAKKAVKKELKELKIDGSKLEIDAKTGKYKYCTNCRRRASKYYYYYFDKTKYEAIVGKSNLKNRITIQIEILSKNNSIFKPKSKMAASPDGGFTHMHYDCKILKLIPAVK
jgi:hypothetical protein